MNSFEDYLSEIFGPPKEEDPLSDSEVQDEFNGELVKLRKKINILKIDEAYIRNVSYINDEATINFNTTYEENEYIDFLNFINLMKQNNKNNKCIINVTNKEFFDKSLSNFENEITGNIFIITEDTAGEEIPIKTYLEKEKELWNLIKPAMDLSPYEKFLFAYNVVKNYKKYKNDKNDVYASRNLYKLIDNEYMVCLGYSNMLGNLLKRLGIESSEYILYVGQDIKDSDGIKEISKAGHARRIVKIYDEKYGIDGIYVSDPTWDNNLENDFYNHALITFEEFNNHKAFNYISPFYGNYTIALEDLFCSTNLTEFYNKVNLLLDKNSNLREPEVIIDLLERIKTFDTQTYEYIVSKYQITSSVISFKKTINFSKEIIQNVLYDLGIYIITKLNKKITGEQLIEGITYLYKNIYHTNENGMLDSKLSQIIYDNKIRHSDMFPTRIINKGNGETIYLNDENKFDIGSDNIKSK